MVRVTLRKCVIPDTDAVSVTLTRRSGHDPGAAATTAVT
jgi:hypothetical protein